MWNRGLLFALSLMLISSLSAQEGATSEGKTWKDGATMSEQYKEFKGSLRRYQKFIYFEDATLDEYYKSVTDTVALLKTELAATKVKVTKLNKEVAELKVKQTEVQAELDKALLEGGTLPTFGARVDKVTFASVMWIVVFGLLALCGFVFFLFKRSHVVTQGAQKDFANLHTEFEDHRKNTLEREKKLRRELQDYINKLEDLKIKGRA